jgi:hypothetical protein
LYEGNEYAAREGVYTGGEGRYKAGFSVSVTGIRDPVVWNAGLRYDVGLSKRERFYTSIAPGDIEISGGISDVLNERFGFSMGIVQGIKMPEIKEGEWDREDLPVATTGSGECFVLFEKIYTVFRGNTAVSERRSGNSGDHVWALV